MFPSLQPHRPKVCRLLDACEAFTDIFLQAPQQPARPTYAPQQTRATHAPPLSQPAQAPTGAPTQASQQKPRSQIEAMPPFASSPLVPPRTVYDSATRHPVFHTELLRRPPFPLPAAATHGWNPVASGYVFEQRKVEANGDPRTKL